ncbi:hypothetical protein [Sansalvadorimonas verongulae]|uniref:hypothetical protein n=1 Tax=Sansalvadorimonas verongulae TaxID=2172824 RepID=UPI0012BD318C|nr:hypothetical protein [Sansalvadorimonas verongulae]MTI12139.1 hypothetical protein [Sansalvadorimonas verongulae]
MELQRVREIEDLIAQNKMTAAQVFTQMKQLVYREAPCYAMCEKAAYEAEIRKLKSLLEKNSTMSAAAPVMLKALKQARDDLNRRADFHGKDTVELGFTAWYDLNRAIEIAEGKESA